MAASSKRLLLFAAKLGYQTHALDAAAKNLGVELFYVTDRCHQLDDPWGDRAIPVHFESPEAAAYTVLNTIRSGIAVDGILALGDKPTVTAAYVARGLGLSYNHPAAVEACRSKLRMREIFREAGLRTPWFRTAPLQPSPEPALLGISYPSVLKPLSLSASQGVIRANNRDEFSAAIARIHRLLQMPEILVGSEPAPAGKSRVEQILIEGYIPGREVAVEGLLTHGELRVLTIFDKPDPLEGPYFEETIYVTPSRLPEAQQCAIERCALNATRALGLSHGPIHAEFRVNEEGAWPLEVAPRPIGGLCAQALSFYQTAEHGSGTAIPVYPEARRDCALQEIQEGNRTISLEGLWLRHALDFPVADYQLAPGASGVMMIPVPQSGILEKVEGESAARVTPHITGVNITARLHDFLAAWPEGSSYLGFLFARAESPGEVESALRSAHSQLKFTLTPRLPVVKASSS